MSETHSSADSGLLKDVRSSIDAIERQGSAALSEIRSQTSSQRSLIVQQISDRAAELRRTTPDVRGNVDAVLLHHFCAASLDERREYACRSLKDKIIQAAHAGNVPVLFTYKMQDYDGHGRLDCTAMTLIDKRNALAPFHSTVTSSMQSMHAFTNEKARVETSKLALVGRTLKGYGGLEALAERGTAESEFVLAFRSIAEGGRGSSMPSTYAFSNTNNDHIMNYGNENGSGICVGWKEIADVLKPGDRARYETLGIIARKLDVNDFAGADSKLKRIMEVVGESDRLLG